MPRMCIALLLAGGCGRIGFDVANDDAGVPPPPDREVLFVEPFDDASFTSRTWYDGSSGLISTTDSAPGSTSSFRCDWVSGEQRCEQGSPRRRLFPETEALYVSFWIKNGPALEGHIYIFDLMTNVDDASVGPNSSHLTLAIAEDQGVLVQELTDSLNVDPNCVRLTAGTIVGCGGNFDTYQFTEARSVCACNGLAGDVQGWQCEGGGGNYFSGRHWQSPGAPFGSPYDDGWHLVEIELRMNSIVAGIGQVDGKFRHWVDGRLVLSSDRILFRTGAHPTQAWNQILFEPFRPTAATRSQTLWLDDLIVARVR